MFIKEDYDAVMQMINAKRSDAYLVPVYVRHYNDTFLLEELRTITGFDPAFHVGFGIKISMFEKKQFPIALFEHFPCITTFTRHDETINTDVKYFVFETGSPEQFPDAVKKKYPELFEQMTYYFNMLKEYLQGQYEAARKRKLAEMMSEYNS